MSEMRSGHSTADHRVELALGYCLRAGVMLAVLLTVVGAALLLRGNSEDGRALIAQHAGRVSGAEFIGGMRRGDGADLILLGLLVLLATPVLRVACMIVAFCWERDWTYAGISAAVLAILMFALFAAR